MGISPCCRGEHAPAREEIMMDGIGFGPWEFVVAIFWVLAVAVLLGWPIARALRLSLPPKLPVLGTLADFQLRDQNGRDFGSTDLRDKVWVADFIFTSAAGKQCAGDKSSLRDL